MSNHPPHTLELSDQEARWAALLAVDLMTRPKDWILRRVETISFDDDRMATRQVVVDFKVPRPREKITPFMPSELANVVLPLALMRKRRVRVFQLANEAGERYPTLTRNTRTYVAQLAICILAKQVLRHEASSKVVAELKTLVSGRISVAYRVHQGFVRAALKPSSDLATEDDDERERAQLFKNEAFRLVAYALTWSYLLLVSVPNEIDARRLMNFSYEERLIDHARRNAVVPAYAIAAQQASRWQRSKWRARQAAHTLGRMLGVAARRFDFPCSSLAYCGSYHLEIKAPRATFISFSGMFVTVFWSPSRNPHILSRDDAMLDLTGRFAYINRSQ